MLYPAWLKNAVIYEIYPQSYNDTNGDGIGDLRGIIEKLDYIQDCGFTAIWLNPVNPSSFRDAGYDVTDYYNVDPRYGTLQDYKDLCDALHARNMKIIFDIVPGHTSIDHPWFIQSGKVEKNEYTNRYIWTVSAFDEGEGIAGLGERDAKCIYNFFWNQPALNYGYAHPDPNKPWELPVDHPDCVAMKMELIKILDFWMDLGTDGFRVDMAESLIKGDTDGSAQRRFWHEIRAHMEQKNPDSLLIAEWGSPRDAVQAGFHLDFLLQFKNNAYTSLFRYEKGRNQLSSMIGHSYFHLDGQGNINDFLDRYLVDLEKTKDAGVIGLVTGNHDMQRLAYGRTPDEIKVAMVFLFTMPGVPFVYYGDEIGMDYIPGLPSKEGGYIRTGSRTPMQWKPGKNHGFSSSDTPYLPTDTRPGAPTVAEQKNDENSLLSLVKKLTALHKEDRRLWTDAAFKVLYPGYPFIFERSADNRRLLVAVNPSRNTHVCKIPAISNIYLSKDVSVEGTQLTMGSTSYIVAEISE